MANAEPRLTTHGESCFDPALYASMYYGDRVLKDNTLNVVQWYLDEFRTIFRDGKIANVGFIANTVAALDLSVP